MINAILNGILTFVSAILTLILSPIDALITSYLPDVSNVISSVATYFSEILSIIPWLLSWFNIPTQLLSVALTWGIAKIMLLLGVHTTKIILAWWRTLKL